MSAAETLPPTKRVEIGALLRVSRIRVGLTIDRCATLLGVNKNAVVEFESGERRVPVHRLALVSEHLEIPLDELTEAWLETEGGMTIALPPNAHPLARQVLVAFAQLWPRLARAREPQERGALAVIRYGLSLLGR